MYGSTKIWVWSHVRRARKLKTQKYLLETPRANSQKYALAKISRYTLSIISFCGTCSLDHLVKLASLQSVKIVVFEALFQANKV